ncbi:uncharacterized protein E0L32_007794 [Thyridium curvatum]|uniref:Zn(2)-C6 fungal-type domain-containing protein n=1 Tax=Thyridium curvatum TaxID=1093900 RepID=A0A507AV33_9PEZI|nr:uncharacterized protein E0L32_007794 [Thyridium curvatum]TPX11583.1 hypothetical protein E0L32_007794 [Thyridium curvatum]
MAFEQQQQHLHQHSSPPSPSQVADKRPRSAASPGDGDGGGGGGADKAAPRPKRAQVSKACARCKKLQKGCSEHRPCQRCLKAGLAEQCVAPQASIDAGFWSTRSGDNSPGTLSATSPRGFVVVPREPRPRNFLPPPVLDHCLDRFFSKLRPTIPILTEDYAVKLRRDADAPDSGPESLATVTAICAMVLLQVEDGESFSFPGIIPEKNSRYGRALFEEALGLHQQVYRRSTPSFTQCLLSFFLYACHSVLFHHSQAFIFLREATTLLLLFRPSMEDPYARKLSERLFWVLLVSERSHGIRYRRPVTLQITPGTPAIEKSADLAGFWNLAALFRPLDTSFIALWNQETFSCPPTAASLANIETAINEAVDHTSDLLDTQKANLRVTQLWLRIILWQIRLHLGHLAEDAHPISLTYHYPLEVAKDLVLSTQDLSVDSIKVHGVGITEKLLDIACAVVDVLARIPLTDAVKHGVGARPEDNLRYVRQLITQLPGGKATYDDLLNKHIQHTLPNLVL